MSGTNVVHTTAKLVGWTTTAVGCTEIKSARANLLFFTFEYANLWSSCRRCCGSFYSRRNCALALCSLFKNSIFFNVSINVDDHRGFFVYFAAWVAAGKAWIFKLFSIGNYLISSAIWNKEARENFSKTKKIARARRATVLTHDIHALPSYISNAVSIIFCQLR